MTDIKSALDRELGSLTFEVDAADIQKIYTKRKHKTYAAYGAGAASLAAAFVILFAANAPAVYNFMSSLQNNSGSFSNGPQSAYLKASETTAETTFATVSSETAKASESSGTVKSYDTIKNIEPVQISTEAPDTQIISKDNPISPYLSVKETQESFKNKVNSLDFTYTVLSDNTVKITGLKTPAKVIDIPEKINGKNVKVIGKNAFEKSEAQKVSLPDTVETIEAYAFCESDSLEEINFPKKLKTIGNYSFEKCVSLKKINLEKIENIGTMAFYKCNALSALNVPSSVKEIGTRAFSSCKSIKTIELNSDYKTNVPYDEYARTFENCTSLQTLKIGEGVTKISEKAFAKCTALSSIKFSDTIKNIFDYAFEECTSLTEITVPKGVEDIGYMAFIGCKNLTKAEIKGDKTALSGYSLGYYKDKYKNPIRISDFTIYCNSGSKAESYAKANKFQTVTGG